MLGGTNVITKAGDGTILALLFGGLNVVTQVGNGSMYLCHLLKTLMPMLDRYQLW
jgi:hypothetical protein